MVERHVANVNVVGSTPIFRSNLGLVVNGYHTSLSKRRSEFEPRQDRQSFRVTAGHYKLDQCRLKDVSFKS